MRFFLAFLPVLAAFAGEAALPEVVNGDFEQVEAQGLPTGWRLGDGATVENLAGNRVLVLKAKQSTANARQQVSLDPSWGTLRFSYRVKIDALQPGSEGWHDARLALQFTDAQGKVTHLGAGAWREATAGWIQARQQVQVPPGAVSLLILPAIFNATGTWALDDLRVELLAHRGEGINADLPTGQTVTWAEEPIEEQTAHRAVVCLNGLWRFQPALGPAAGEALATGWGWLRVPGSWRHGDLPTLTRGSGPAWEGFDTDSPAGWYERDLTIPAAWKGRKVVLDLQRVSTDAVVQIDGREVGSVAWPGGEVDLTAAVEPGRTHRLRVKVIAVTDQAELLRFQGMGDGQISTTKAVLRARGLCGDVLLASRPRGASLTGCAIRTTVKPATPASAVQGDSLTVLADYQGLPAAGGLVLGALVRNAAGVEVRRFTATVQATAGAGTVQAAWRWQDPELWDVGRPNLYSLELSLRGPGLDDSLREAFGFRDFRIEGRRFLLNGTEIHLRPAEVRTAKSTIGGNRELIGAALDGLRLAGFNTYEMWPWNRDERGSWEFDALWCEEADRRGFLLIGPALDQVLLVADWDKPGVAEGWNARMRPQLKRLRNHPSVVMWVTGPNRFMHGQDQNPEVIGQHDRAWLEDPRWRRVAAVGLDAIRRIKEVDPTRPVFMHAGGPVGDVYSSNNYLCLTPLQEREEWLSRWARDGDMPVLMVEFGTPLIGTFHRGRRGYMEAVVSEPLYTEYQAIYLGAEAYRLESATYRDNLARCYVSEQTWKSIVSGHIETALPDEGFLRLQTLFLTNTWRTWRTWGISGGMLPWSNGHGWQNDASSEMGGPAAVQAKPLLDPLAAFVPGQRGAWRGEAPRGQTRYLRPEGMPANQAGEALVAANQETLAWIAGFPDFVDKTHHVGSGLGLAKQVAILNDGRSEARWDLSWSAELGGTTFATGSLQGTLAAAGRTLAPIRLVIPGSLAADRVAGVIRMDCTIGSARHQDSFPFTAFRPAPPATTAAVALLDPVGDTAGLLRTLAIPAVAWDGAPTGRLVVVGRNAFASGDADPASLEQHLRAGGRVLLMAQDPGWLKDRLGLRVARHLTRRAYPVIPDHPALAGLDAEAFRDWAGDSRLVPPVDAPYSEYRHPLFGWRWGSRHVVSSAAIEIPHRAGWRPILACEFDGAYTPLAEAAVAGGMITLCTLDLEDHAAADIAAERVARAVIAAAATVAVEQREAATYLGGEAGAALLEASGLSYQRATLLPARGCVVLGADATAEDAALEAFLRRGGRVLVLPRSAAEAPLGVKLASADKHPGSLAVPAWASCRGLWPGELHRRTDGPAWTISGGADAVGADGLLGEVRRGDGVAVFCQLDSALLDADRLAYNRFTRWRWTRVLAQLGANLGIACLGDDRLLHPLPLPERASLAGTWKALLTTPLPATGANDPKPKDPGISPRALALTAPGADETGMQEVEVSKGWESYGGAWLGADGEAVFRRSVEIPALWAGHALTLSLGAIDDFDTTYFDGEAVGTTSATTPSFWSHPRRYAIPARLATAGRHVIAVRIFDVTGGGGMMGEPAQLVLERTERPAPPPQLYHPDYRTDFPLGDDPYRYCRW